MKTISQPFNYERIFEHYDECETCEESLIKDALRDMHYVSLVIIEDEHGKKRTRFWGPDGQHIHTFPWCLTAWHNHYLEKLGEAA